MVKRVALFLPSLHGGGAERAMVTFGRELLRRGFAVDVVVVQRIGALLGILPDGMRVVDLKRSRMVQALPALIRYINSELPDAVFSTITHANLLAAAATRLTRHRPITVVRQSNAPLTEPKASLSSSISHRLIPLLYPWADGIIAVSRGVGEQLAQMSSSLAPLVTVSPTPVISPEILALGDEPLSHPWFEAGGPPVVVAAGRLEPQKGFSTLLRAFERVRRTEAARLIIIGEGRERGRLEGEIRQLNLTEDVDMPGFQKNPFAFMKRAQSFVLSSQYEGLPNVLIQAMAFGTPVVATDCESGPAEILENGRYGALVPVGDEERLAEALRTSLRLSRNLDAQRSVIARYGVAQATDRYLALAGFAPSLSAPSHG